jgi:hypothetical protein
MHRAILFAVLLNSASAGTLAAQRAQPLLERWKPPSTSLAWPDPWAISRQDSVAVRGDYRYEGLAFGGLVFGTLGAWVGSRDFAICPLEPGVPCGDNDKLERAVVLGLAGAAIGGGLGYLVGRLSPKKPRPDSLLGRQPFPALASVPDSVRRKVGYQHWRGAGIGLVVGGVVGALTGAVAGSVGSCSDCSQQPSAGTGAIVVGLLGAGVGGVAGFLAGLSSPKYVWVPSTSLPQ